MSEDLWTSLTVNIGPRIIVTCHTLRFSLDGIEFVLEIDHGCPASLEYPGDPPSWTPVSATWNGKELRDSHLARYLEGKHNARFLARMEDALSEEVAVYEYEYD